MKFLLPSLLVVLCCFSQIAAQNSPLPTRITTLKTNAANIPLEFDEQSTFFYTDQGHINKDRTNEWNGLDWDFYTQNLYVTDAAGNIVERIFQKRNTATATWVSENRISYQYNGNNQGIFSTFELWKPGTGTWELRSTTETTYSNTGKVLENTSKIFVGNVVSSGTRNLYTYDGNDRVIELSLQTWSNGPFVNNQKISYQYNGDEVDIQSSSTSSWNLGTNAWAASHKRAMYSYAPNQWVVLEEKLLNNEWEPFARSTHQSDDNDLPTVSLYETWNTTTLDWVLTSGTALEYNMDQSLSKYILSRIDNNTDVLFDFYIANYDYEVFVDVHSPTLAAKVTLSPNPAHDFVQVELDNDQPTVLRLYDVHGVLVNQMRSYSKSTSMLLTGQKSGTYFLYIEQGGAVRVMPLVKM